MHDITLGPWYEPAINAWQELFTVVRSLCPGVRFGAKDPVQEPRPDREVALAHFHFALALGSWHALGLHGGTVSRHFLLGQKLFDICYSDIGYYAILLPRQCLLDISSF